MRTKTGRRKPAEKKFWEMNTRELAEATREFNREFIIDEARPLTRAMAERWRRARRRPATKAQQGTEIRVMISPDILRKADRLAKRMDINRTRLIELGLLELLALQAHSTTS